VRWSISVTSTSRLETPLPSQLDSPPAFSTSSPSGATSKSRRSFALVEGDVTLEKTPARAAEPHDSCERNKHDLMCKTGARQGVQRF
jgi:hypothetical protein